MLHSSTTLWLLAGVALCLMELLLPTAFVELTMGISAIFVALVALIIPSSTVQVVIWLVLSVLLSVGLRRFVPQPARSIEAPSEAQTLTEILPGQTGRVLYEGNSWQARCEDEQMAIASNQTVYIVKRRGTTLIVMPERLFRS
jgi:membrane protein implicated in regulation of membrane protease activity